MGTGRPPGAKDKQPRKKREDGNMQGVKASPIYQGQIAEIPQEYNARRIQFMMEIMPQGKLDIEDVAEMERRFANYLQKCQQWGMKVGNQAAYAAIGISKQDAWRWVNEVKSNPERSDFIKKVQQICALYREGLMEDGKVNPAVGIFWQKNYDGLKDEQEVVLTPNNPLGDTRDAESLKQKYLDVAYDAESETLSLPESTQKAAEIAESPEREAVPVKVLKDSQE